MGGSDVRADVSSFLWNLYNSCAETLPDVRDDAAESGELELVLNVRAGSDGAEEDPYAKAMADAQNGKLSLTRPAKKKKPRKRAKGVELLPKNLSCWWSRGPLLTTWPNEGPI